MSQEDILRAFAAPPQRGPDPQELAQTQESLLAALLGFAGAAYGLRRGRLRNLWHGTSDSDAVRAIAQQGFTRGGSAELHIPGTSVSDDPLLSLRNFAESNPKRMLRVETPVSPESIRNLSPGEYAAFGSPLAPLEGRALGYSKPQSYYSESEIFFPRPESAESVPALRGRPLEEGEQQSLRKHARRHSPSGTVFDSASLNLADQIYYPTKAFQEARAGNGTLEWVTPAKLLQTIQAAASKLTRSERTSFTRNTLFSDILYLDVSDSSAAKIYKMLFPDTYRDVLGIAERAQMVSRTYTQQRSIGEHIASLTDTKRKSSGGSSPDELKTAKELISQQNESYRNFTVWNNELINDAQALNSRYGPVRAREESMTMNTIFTVLEREGVGPYQLVPRLEVLADPNRGALSPQALRAVVQDEELLTILMRSPLYKVGDWARQIKDVWDTLGAI